MAPEKSFRQHIETNWANTTPNKRTRGKIDYELELAMAIGIQRDIIKISEQCQIALEQVLGGLNAGIIDTIIERTDRGKEKNILERVKRRLQEIGIEMDWVDPVNPRITRMDWINPQI